MKVTGKILYLTEDAGAPQAAARRASRSTSIRRQHALVNNISTDELTPGWVCYYYDETLARYCLVGLRGGVVQQDAIKNGGFGVIVSGISKGCGSARARRRRTRELKAGIQLVIAKSIEKIYGQNAQNIGLLTTHRLRAPRRASSAARRSRSREFTQGLDPISAGDRRARRALRVQQGAPRGRGLAARDHDAARGR